MLLSSSQNKEQLSLKKASMQYLLLPIKPSAQISFLPSSRHFQADKFPISLDQSEEEVQTLLLLLKSPQSKQPNLRKNLQRKPNQSKSQRLRNKRWIWEDSLIDLFELFNSNKAQACYIVKQRVINIREIKISQQINKQMDQSLDSTPNNKDINAFLSSYFSDLGRTISGIRDLVLTLINVKIPSLPDLEVGSDMLSIVTACHKTYNDLKKVESLLRGHVQAKSVANTQKSRLTIFSPIYQEFRNRNSSYSWSQGPQTPFFSSRSVKKSSDFTMKKPLSVTTYVSRYNTQQNKSTRDQHKGQRLKKIIKMDNAIQLDTSFRKMKEIECQKSAKHSQNQRISSVKSVEIVKKIQELRQIGTSQILNFEHKNQKCLGIIRQMKQEFKLKSSKLKRKTNKK